MEKNTAIYLNDIALRTNGLVDGGANTSLDKVHEVIENGSIIKWLSDSGADMSILLSGEMDDVKAAVIDQLQRVANARKGSERRKLGVENNGYCLVIALVFEALAIDDD